MLFVGRAGCFFAPLHREFEGNPQQCDELGGKCGLIEIVLLEFDLTSMQEARSVDGRRVHALHGFGVFPFTAYRAGDRGEAVVEKPRPVGHNSDAPVESLPVLGQHPGLAG